MKGAGFGNAQPNLRFNAAQASESRRLASSRLTLNHAAIPPASQAAFSLQLNE
jgi:hypothetical protein